MYAQIYNICSETLCFSGTFKTVTSALSTATKSLYLSFLYYVQNDHWTCKFTHDSQTKWNSFGHLSYRNDFVLCGSSKRDSLPLLMVTFESSKRMKGNEDKRWQPGDTENPEIHSTYFSSTLHRIFIKLYTENKLILLSSKIIYECKHLRFVLIHRHTLRQNISYSYS